MSAHNHHISSIIISFSTFLENQTIATTTAEDAVLLLVDFLRQKKTLDRWEAPEVHAYVDRVHTAGSHTYPPEAIQLVTQFVDRFPPYQANVFLHEFVLALKSDGCSPATIKNYRSDINQFIQFAGEYELTKLLAKPKITDFLRYEKEKGLKTDSVKRKLVSISQFVLWGQKQGLLTQTELWLTELNQNAETIIAQADAGDSLARDGVTDNRTSRETSPNTDQRTWSLPTATPLSPKNVSAWHNSQSARGRQDYRARLQAGLSGLTQKVTQETRRHLLPYLNLLMIALFFLGASYLGWKQFGPDAPQPFAYPSALTRPNRTLSFQGRLTDTSQNPIYSSTNLQFKLYNTGPGSGGTLLWNSGTCAITPDQDGIFTTGLGDDCGAEIGADVFTENSNVWLEVTVGAETLAPRQQIKTVAYALNSETLQGYPASASAVENTVLVMNNSGEVVFGNTNPVLKATGTSFAIEANTLTLRTTAGSNGNVVLDPDGTGLIALNANASASGTLTFTGTTDPKIQVLNGENFGISTSVGGDAGLTERFTVLNGGNVGIGTTTPGAKLNIVRTGNTGNQFRTFDSEGATAAVRTYSTADGDGLILNQYYAVAGSPYLRNADFVASMSDTSATQMRFLTKNLSSNPAVAMVIDKTGNVGIGTTGPAEKLQVVGNTRADSYYMSAISASGLDVPAATYNLSLHGQSNVTGDILMRPSWATTGGAFRVQANTTDVLTVLMTGNVGIGDATPTYLLDVNGTGRFTGAVDLDGDLELNSTLTDVNGSVGTSGQILSSTATGVDWIDPAGLGVKWNAIVSPDGNQALTMGAYTTAWAWDSLTTGTGLTASSTSLSSGSLASLSVASTAAASNTQKVLSIGTSGANATNTQTTYGLYATNTHTGTASTNVAGYFSASGGTNNYAAIFENGNVGIGTTGPTEKLTVSGNVQLSGQLAVGVQSTSGLQFINNGTIGTVDALPLIFRTGSTEQVRITTAGNVGLGTTVPSNTLTLNAVYPANPGLDFSSSGTKVGTVQVLGATGEIRIGSTFSTYFPTFYSGNAEAMRISTTGNVGIGTTAPGYALDVEGIGLRLKSTASSPALWLTSADTGTSTINFGGSTNPDKGRIFYTDNSDFMSFYTADTEWMRIATSGNVGIGTTAPLAKLDILGTDDAAPYYGIVQIRDATAMAQGVGGSIGFLGDYGSGNQTNAAYIKAYKENATGSNYAFALTLGTRPNGGAMAERVRIDSTGNVGIGTTGPGAQLDITRSSQTLGLKVNYDYGTGVSGNYSAANIIANYGSGSNGAVTGLKIDTTNSGSGATYGLLVNGGNVGIGTTNPLQKLQVAGDINIESGSGVRVNNTATSGQYLRGDGTRFVSSTIQAGDLPTISTAGGWTDDGTVVRLTTSTDNVGIGTTAPGASLHVAGNLNGATNFVGYFYNSNVTNGAGLLVDAGVGASDQVFRLRNRAATTEIMTALANGNVGIGTTGPQGNLHVYGATTPRIIVDGPDATSVAMNISSAGTTKWSVGRNATTNTFFITQPGSNEFQITTGGNVGIGTTAPSQKLQVIGGSMGFFDSATTAGVTIDPGTGASQIFSDYLSGTEQALQLGTFSSKTAVHITTGGNVGIGTTGPGYKLDVAAAAANGNAFQIRADGTADTIFSQQGNTSGTQQLFSIRTNAAAAVHLNTQNSARLSLGVNTGTTAGSTTEQLTIISGGNVGIGTTAPAAKLDVTSGDIRINRGQKIGTYYGAHTNGGTLATNFGNYVTTSFTGMQINTVWDGTYNDESIAFYTHDGGVSNDVRMTIDKSGLVGIGTTAPTTALDVNGQVRVRTLSGTATSALCYDGTGILTPCAATSSITGTGVANYVARWSSATNLGTGVLYDNGTNVGIGTTGPFAKLHVDGDFQFGGAAINDADYYIKMSGGESSVNSGNGRNLYVTAGSTDNQSGKTGGSLYLQPGIPTSPATAYGNVIIADAGGNVGIGTASPGTKLDVNGYVRSKTGYLDRNMLDTTVWTVSTGGIGDFTRNGDVAENERIWSTDPLGRPAIIWKSVNDAASNDDGGWNYSVIPVSANKAYRASVWVKKDNTASGTVYFGANSDGSTLDLGGTTNGNPYYLAFGSSNLIANRWYLLVGYIHANNDASVTSYSAVYDGVTGKKILTGTDYKNSASATIQVHRAYNFYDTTNGAIQYFASPRFEEIDGNEPTIESLLGLYQGATNETASFFGGNVGIGTTGPGAKLDVNGVIYIRSTNALAFADYGGGWFMQDTTWLRTLNGKSIWTGGGVLGSDGGLSIGYGGTTPPSTGAIIAGNVGIGTTGPTNGKLEIQAGAGTPAYLQSSIDSQLTLKGTDAWAGMTFSDVAGTDYIWYSGSSSTFAIGGGGATVAGKKLHVDGGMTIGANYDATAMNTNGLSVEGIVTSSKILPTYNATLGVPTYQEGQIELLTSSNYTPALGFHRSGYSAATIYETGSNLYINPNGGTPGIIWHAGVDGAGSGLDADLLDGKTSTEFCWSSGSNCAVPAAGGGWVDDGTTVRLATSTDSVGIGTTAPAGKLDIYGDIYGVNEFSVSGASEAINNFEYYFAGSGAANPTINDAADDSWYVQAGLSTWAEGLLSRRRFRRTPGLTLEYEAFLTGGHYMIGFADGNSGSYTYGQTPANLLYHDNTNLSVYDNGGAQGTDYNFDSRGAWWRFKVVLKGAGADYYIYRDGVWNKIKSTSNNSNKYVRLLVSAHSNRMHFRNMRVYQENQQHIFGSIELANPSGAWGTPTALHFTNSDPAQGTGSLIYKMNTSSGVGGGFSFAVKNSSATMPVWSDAAMVVMNTGNVGIGTTGPLQRLDVRGGNLAIDGSGGFSIYSWTPADANWRIGMSIATGFTKSLATSHTQYLTYASGAGQGFAVGVNGGNSSFEINGADHTAYFRGNVGIGTTAPGYKLDVNGNGKIGGIIFQASDPGNVPAVYTNGAATYINSVSGDWVTAGYARGNGLLVGGGGGTGTLTASGKISSTVNGASYFRGGDDAELWDVNVANTVGIYGVQNSALGCIRLGSGASDICGSGGNVGIGTTGPGAKLVIEGNTASNLAGVQMSAAANRYYSVGQSATNNVLMGWNYNATPANAYGLLETYGGSNPLVLQNAGGNVGIGTTAPTTFKLQVAGSVGPNADASYDLGSAGLRWRDLYLSGSINQSGYLAPDNDNLLYNSDFELGTSGWTGATTPTIVTGGYSGNNAGQHAGDFWLLSNDFIPVDPTRDVLQLEGYFKKTVAGGLLYFGYIAYDANKNAITTAPCGAYCYFAASGYTIPVDGNWHKFSSTTTGEGTSSPNFPVGTKFVRVLGLINYAGAGTTQFDHITLKRINHGPLFVGNNFNGTNMLDQHQATQLYTTAANNFIITPPSSGNVGIGTTAPGAGLHIASQKGALAYTTGYQDNHDLMFTVPTGANYFSQMRWAGGGGQGENFFGVTQTTGNQLDFFWKTFNGSAYNERMRLTEEGNLGIGTTGPAAKLHIMSEAGLDGGVTYGTNTAGISIQTSTATAGYGNGLWFYNSGLPAGIASSRVSPANWATDLRFYTHQAAVVNQNTLLERMRIDSEGNVGIGTTAPGGKLEVEANAADGVMIGNFTEWGGSNHAGIKDDHAHLMLFTNPHLPNGYYYRYGGTSESTSYDIGISSNTFQIGTTTFGGTATSTTFGGAVVVANSGSTTIQSGESGLWINNSNGLYVGDGRDWDRYVGFNYAAGTTGGAAGVLSIGQTSKNNPSFTHGITHLYTNGVTRLAINNSGNVGIGTTAPGAKLDVSGGANISGRLNFGTDGTTPYNSATGTSSGMSFNGWESSSLRTYGIFTEMENVGGNYSKLTLNWHTGVRIGASYSYGGIRFYDNYATTGNMVFSVAQGDSNVRVTNTLFVAGNVGIGTTSAGAKLVVSGGAAALDDAQPIFFAGTGDTNWQFGRNIMSNGTEWLTSNTLQAKVYNGANQGFQVINSSNVAVFEVEGDSNGKVYIKNKLGIANTSFTRELEVGGSANFATSVFIAGSCHAGACTSDRTLKTNIQPFASPLATIEQLNPVTFEFIDPLNGPGIQYGLIAQELQQVRPDWVFTGENGKLGINYGLNFQMLALAGIKEQQAVIATLATAGELTITSTGEIAIAGQTADYAVTNTTDGTVVTKIAVLADAVIGKLRAGLITTRDLVVTQAATVQSLVVTQTVAARDLIVEQTAQIAHLSVQSLTIGGQNLQQYVNGLIAAALQDTTAFLAATPAADQPLLSPVANLETLTAQTATISGSLQAGSVATTELTATGPSKLGSLMADNATISGTLTTTELSATSARVTALEAGMAQLEEVRAQVAELTDLKSTNFETTNATISGTLYAANIHNLDQQVAAALRQPTLLELLLHQETNNPAPVANVITTVESLGYTATSSASLRLALADLQLDSNAVVLETNALFVSQYLEVNGIAYVADQLGVGNSLTVGNGLTLTSGALSYAPALENPSDTLFQIQPAGRGTLSLLAGLMTLNENGQVTITGNLAVTGDIKTEGTLLADLLKPTDYGSPLQVQVAGVATESGTVTESRFEIINELQSPVATISAKGKADFAAGVGIAADNLTAATATEGALLSSDKTAGKATILANTADITIAASALTSESLIYVTPLGSTQNQSLYIKAQQADNPFTVENEAHFVVGFDFPTTQAVAFTWWIVN